MMNTIVHTLVKKWRLVQSPLLQTVRFNQAGNGKLNNVITQKHRPSNMDKRLLIWTGKYKTMEEIPETVSAETIHKAKSKGRIRMANYMILATCIGCFAMILSGKRAADRGESVQGYNQEWHRQVKEDHDRKVANAAK